LEKSATQLEKLGHFYSLTGIQKRAKLPIPDRRFSFLSFPVLFVVLAGIWLMRFVGAERTCELMLLLERK
jgi:hypothetical protein